MRSIQRALSNHSTIHCHSKLPLRAINYSQVNFHAYSPSTSLHRPFRIGTTIFGYGASTGHRPLHNDYPLSHPTKVFLNFQSTRLSSSHPIHIHRHSKRAFHHIFLRSSTIPTSSHATHHMAHSLISKEKKQKGWRLSIIVSNWSAPYRTFFSRHPLFFEKECALAIYRNVSSIPSLTMTPMITPVP